MGFTLPNFNLLADRWTGGHNPAFDPPDVVGIPVQLYVNPRILETFQVSLPYLQPGWLYFQPSVFLRMPTATVKPILADIIEVVPGSADYYFVRWTQKVHQGFTNEYLLVLCEQCTNDGSHPREGT